MSPRRFKYTLFTVSFMIGMLCVFMLIFPFHNSTLQNRVVLKTDADTLQNTRVSVHLQTEIDDGNSVLWCASFQIAWNQLCALAGGKVGMQEEHKMVSILNAQAVTEADLDPSSYVAAAGIVGDGIIKQLRDGMLDKFGDTETSHALSDVEDISPGTLIAFSYIAKELPFEWAFERLDEPLNFAGTPVAAFGIDQYLKRQENEKKAADQVLIYSFKSNDDFIVELKTVEKNDHLYLAKVVPSSTLHETIEAVLNRIQSTSPEHLQQGASLVVPVIDFEVNRRYHELCHKPIQTANPRLNGYEFAVADQLIRFRLDETGAKLRSRALLASAMAQDLIFDQPFLIVLCREGARNPYFAMWVANEELMVPFQRK